MQGNGSTILVNPNQRSQIINNEQAVDPLTMIYQQELAALRQTV